jgi:transcriptional regulator GlxA family with amidase domain
MVRADHGTEVANAIARSLVIPQHREGGQAQYMDQLLPIEGALGLGPTFDLARAHLEMALTVEELARQAKMSPRTFARRFRDVTGTTPLQWLCSERVRGAHHELENTEDTMDRIAGTCGFGSAHVMRTHFTRIVHVTPHELRRTFRTHGPA